MVPERKKNVNSKVSLLLEKKQDNGQSISRKRRKAGSFYFLFFLPISEKSGF